MPHFQVSIEPSTESQLLLAARRRRKSLMLKNDTHRFLFVGLDKPATADDWSAKLSPDQEWYAPANYEGSLSIALDLTRQPFEVNTGRSGLVSAVEIY